VHIGTSITEGPNAFAWLLDQIEDKSDLPLGTVSGRFDALMLLSVGSDKCVRKFSLICTVLVYSAMFGIGLCAWKPHCTPAYILYFKHAFANCCLLFNTHISTHLKTICPELPGEPVPEKCNQSGFTGARDCKWQ